jgi:hypothetical protein
MEQTECSETSAYKIQTLGNYPEENIQQLLCWNPLSTAAITLPIYAAEFDGRTEQNLQALKYKNSL